MDKKSCEGKEQSVVWESCGYSSFFGLPILIDHYILHNDSISVKTGFPLSKTVHIKLKDIVMIQTLVSPFGNLFHCGRIVLTPRGWNVDSISLSVRYPEAVAQLIQDTKSEDKRIYLENKKQRENKKKRRGRGKNAANE